MRFAYTSALRRTASLLAHAVRRSAEIIFVERRYRQPVPLAMDAGDHEALVEGRNAYAPSPWRILSCLLPPDEVDGRDVFVDFGCGKGRVLLEAAEQYRFRRVVGVEVEPRLAEAARMLLTENQGLLGGRRWEVVTADVLEYEIPDDLTVAYLYDPFTGPVFDAVLSRLEASVARSPRTVRIVYLVPKEIARVREHDGIVPLRAGTTGWLRGGGRYPYFVGELRPAG
jgi:SAM-dependent methyltransferase